MKTASLPETKLRRAIDKAMEGTWRFTWHEDREISPGVPDLHYVMLGDTPHRVGWLELKAIDTQITKSQRIGVEPSQHQYCRKWAGLMPIYFLVRVQERIFVIPGNRSREISLASCRADLAIISHIQFDESEIVDYLPKFLRDITKI